MSHLVPFYAAGRLLTRLPFPDPGVVDPADQGRSVAWYPAVGLVLGALLALAALAAQHTDPLLGAALLLAFWTWSTGGLHCDGLADSADAWIGGLGDRARTLEIMKDPRSGPMAVAVLGLALQLKWSALQLLLDVEAAWLLLWVPLLARAVLPPLLLTTAYARTQGIVSDQVAHLGRTWAWVASGAAFIGCVLMLGGLGLVLVGCALAVLWLARRAMLARLGGFTGDTAGALVELTEIALVVLAALLLGG
ncbi:cobalamin-5-phosphate synthase [Marichromatium purpuratum 984]|uniref:Adenosylcobinamide-GDP ribazoletransferase n=1 Tax=Marichromatium purpuratum 984 TaxID=765910 RepID=W0E240_MARPU|nr:adenosylcobinamide-GDP ribazoletransferase [Marichromatium purpuratum]AHF03284.1 cobalamin-5-phosphate synthase [Marichromatium purpuratum 984]